MSVIVQARSLERHGSDGSRLLGGIDLEIAAGDRIALAGPSGSGKTVLLRALALLDPLDGGEIRLDGQPVEAAGTPAYRCRIAYLHQAPALVDGSVEDNLRLPFTLAAHRHRGFDRARAVDLLQRLGRGEELLRRRRDQLSGGEGQLVALARLLQLGPSVLLLDEPTAALDPDSAARARLLLDQWQRAAPDRAYLWVTHDAALATEVAARRLRLAAGELESAS